jgi:uroporphyrin-III C-methyltransferase
MKAKQKIGKVIFVGAGPGDPDLLTLKAASCLANAEAVLVDRLVSPEIINRHVNADAAVIPVGKQAGKDGSTPQVEINDLLVQLAKEGKLVVRLKGGDTSIFSNILDELRALVDNQIEYEIIPGITAAMGAAAFAGIPLTAREYSTAVRFLTYYKPEFIANEYWKDLAQTNDTLVFYMSVQQLGDLVNRFISNGVAPGKPLAIIEQATTPFQRVIHTSFSDFTKDCDGKTFLSPSLVIIGKVVELHKMFQWYKPNAGAQTYYFEPLTDPVRDLASDQKIIDYHVAGK